MPTKFLFTGEETFLIHQEITKRKESFVSKYGEAGLFERKGDEQTLGDLKNSLMGGGFFSTKKLIIIYGVPKDGVSSYSIGGSLSSDLGSWLQTNREKIPSEHVVVLVSHKPDKRTSDYKFFSKESDVKEFKPLSSSQRISYAKNFLGNQLTSDQYERVVHTCGPSLGVLHHTLQRIQLYSEYHQIKTLPDEPLAMILSSHSEDNAFTFLDLLIQDKKKAVDYLYQLQDQGNDPFQTLGMLYWGLKIIIGMIDSWEQGFSSSKEIASRIKAPPFTISKYGKYKKEIQQHCDYWKTFFIELTELDYRIKTGQLPIESFWVSIKAGILAD